MNIVNLCCYGEGNYSGATYEENIAISEDFYNKIASIFTEDYEVYLGELDGKYSEVMGTIEVQPFKEDEIADAGFEDNNDDGDSFYWSLKDKVEGLGLDLDQEIKAVTDFISSIDKVIDVTVRVKQSDKDRVIEFAKSLYE